MKQIIMLIMIISTCISISACKNSKQIEIFPTYGINADNTLKKNQIDNFVNPLEEKDFSIHDTKNNVILDSSYKEFKIEKPEELQDNNYVGEIYSGEIVYKVYIHKYADFNLYVSNSNYNLKNRNFDEYYITQITLKNSNFKTYRGITIGSNVEDIVKSYGSVKESIEDDNTVLIYTLNDMKMSFTIDGNQKVQDVVLSIVIQDIP